MVFSTGYQANLGIISTIAGKDDYIILDIDSHASIYDGCALGNAEIVPFRHNDVEALEKRLEAHSRRRRQAGRARRRLFDARRHRPAQGDGRRRQGQRRDGAGRRGAFDGLHRRARPRRRRGAGRASTTSTSSSAPSPSRSARSAASASPTIRSSRSCGWSAGPTSSPPRCRRSVVATAATSIRKLMHGADKRAHLWENSQAAPRRPTPARLHSSAPTSRSRRSSR